MRPNHQVPLSEREMKAVVLALAGETGLQPYDGEEEESGVRKTNNQLNGMLLKRREMIKKTYSARQSSTK